MLPARSPIIIGSKNLRQKAGRIPLQPKNIPANPVNESAKKNPNQDKIEISLVGNSDKENHHHHPIDTTTPSSPITNKVIESIDSSLAEELSVIRKKFERLKLEKEKTERVLREKDLVLEMEMIKIEERGEKQRSLQIEVERMLRLNELKSVCVDSPIIQSLRELEEAKKIKELTQLEVVKIEQEMNNKPQVSEEVDQKVEKNSFIST